MPKSKKKIERKEFYPWQDVEEWLSNHTNIEIVGFTTRPYKYDKDKDNTVVYYKEK